MRPWLIATLGFVAFVVAYYMFLAPADDREKAAEATSAALDVTQRESTRLKNEAQDAIDRAKAIAERVAAEKTQAAVAEENKKLAEAQRPAEKPVVPAPSKPTADPAKPASIPAPPKGDLNAPELVKGYPLFNGEDLLDWYVYLDGQSGGEDPDKVFSITPEKHLRISGQHKGYLATKSIFSNYRLVAEFKWGNKTWDGKNQARDSGLFFHGNGPDKLWMQSLEVQMKEGATGDLCLIAGGSLNSDKVTKSAGCFDRPGKGAWKNELGFRGADEVENPHGAWNTIELICQGNNLRVSINGRLIRTGYQAAPHAGKIYLQSLNAELFYRKIEITPLAVEK